MKHFFIVKIWVWLLIDKILRYHKIKRFCSRSSNEPNQQIQPHPIRWHYPLIRLYSGSIADLFGAFFTLVSKWIWHYQLTKNRMYQHVKLSLSNISTINLLHKRDFLKIIDLYELLIVWSFPLANQPFSFFAWRRPFLIEVRQKHDEVPYQVLVLRRLQPFFFLEINLRSLKN